MDRAKPGSRGEVRDGTRLTNSHNRNHTTNTSSRTCTIKLPVFQRPQCPPQTSMSQTITNDDRSRRARRPRRRPLPLVLVHLQRSRVHRES